MEKNWIIISEYCEKSHTDRDFLDLQLGDLERYCHLYYDLSINIEGIDAIRHMLARIEDLQREVHHLRRQLSRFRDSDALFLEE